MEFAKGSMMADFRGETVEDYNNKDVSKNTAFTVTVSLRGCATIEDVCGKTVLKTWRSFGA